MPERTSPSITVVKVVHDAATAEEAQALLLLPKPKGVSLMIFVEGKFDGRKFAIVRNIGANYPIEPIVLHNTAMLAMACDATPVYYRDGFELFCLERAAQDQKLERLLLLRGSSMPSDEDVRRFEESSEPVLTKTHGTGEQQSLMLDCRSGATREAIAVAAEMYRSGAVLSLAEQGIPNVLRVVIDALAQREAAAGETRTAGKFHEPRGLWAMWLKRALAWTFRLHVSRR